MFEKRGKTGGSSGCPVSHFFAARQKKWEVTHYPLNKFGMVNGHVETMSPDAAELPDTREHDRKDTREHVMPPSGFRALVALDSPYLERDGKRFRVSAGMLVSAEVNIGSRTVMEHLLWRVRRSRMKRGGRGKWAIFQARLRAYVSKASLDVDEFHT